jgi:hypothetical protein
LFAQLAHKKQAGTEEGWSGAMEWNMKVARTAYKTGQAIALALLILCTVPLTGAIAQVNSGSQGSDAYYATSGSVVSGTADFVKAAAFGFGNVPTANDTAMSNLLSAMATNHQSVVFPPGFFPLANTNQIDLTTAFNGLVFQGTGGGNAEGGACGTILKFNSNITTGSINGATTTW